MKNNEEKKKIVKKGGISSKLSLPLFLQYDQTAVCINYLELVAQKNI